MHDKAQKTTEKVKVTVSLPQDTVNDIKQLAEALGISASELLRRAVRTEKFLDSVETDEGKVLIQRPGQNMMEIIRR
jgi:Arc/MetJ-type ribon-helix-helix transcriptional regulator